MKESDNEDDNRCAVEVDNPTFDWMELVLTVCLNGDKHWHWHFYWTKPKKSFHAHFSQPSCCIDKEVIDLILCQKLTLVWRSRKTPYLISFPCLLRTVWSNQGFMDFSCEHSIHFHNGSMFSIINSISDCYCGCMQTNWPPCSHTTLQILSVKIITRHTLHLIFNIKSGKYTRGQTA